MGKFELGEVVVTQGVAGLMASDRKIEDEVCICICRHWNGDWGDMCDEDMLQNEYGLKHEGRIFSQYCVGKGEYREKIWIITEWNRSATTILLPEEY